MSRLTFEGDEYRFKDLVALNSKSKFYKEGEVIDLEDGEVFDIKDIAQYKHKYFNEVIDNNYKNNIIKKQNTKDSIKTLTEKYNNKTISTAELKELITLTNSKKEPFSISYMNFIIVNIGKELPEELSDVEIGKFYRLLSFLTKEKNLLKKSDRENGRCILQQDLMEHLKFSTQKVYRRFMLRLVKSNMLREVKDIDNNRVIMLNPVYVNKGILVDYTTYLCFKDDLQEYLSEYEIAYFEKIADSTTLTSGYKIIN